MKYILKSLVLIGALLLGRSTQAQVANLIDSNISALEIEALNIAKAYIQSHMKTWGLTAHDIAGMSVNDQYTDVKTGITRIYFLQRYNGFPVYNAILNVNITKDGEVFFVGNRFVQDLDDKVNATVPKLSPDEAVTALAAHLGLPSVDFRMKMCDDESQFIFDKSEIANEDIIAELCYQPYEGAVRMAWNILLEPKGTHDKWSTRVDAVTGKVLAQHNWTIYCNQGGMASLGEENSCQEHPDFFSPTTNSSLDQGFAIPNEGDPIQAAKYNVWPAPIESPNHGPRTLVTSPADTIASPYGWHDTDGQPGPEYTITRGNNVHAFQDRNGLLNSSNDEPEGGSELLFDFPYDPSLEPEHYVDASVVNLFYWTNYMHDFSYHFGFDEAAGNFQFNNYGKGGIGNDALKVMAQQGANTGNVNNGYYAHNIDGAGAYMRIFIFRGQKKFLTVNEPVNIAGLYKTSFPSQGWGSGAYIKDIPVTGEVVKVNDGIDNPYTSDACEPILNTAELAGKIALLDRGGCEFSWKALQAQQAGAIAVVVCGIDDDDYTMNPGTYGADVNIPILMIGSSDCQSISSYEGSGLNVTLMDPGQLGPESIDGDLDNGLLIHEYGHGISDRLVGGPSSVCLLNAENMGEGWSDFFTLAVTARPGDTGETRRGFVTYATRDEPTGKGFRRFPYSTDMSVMPLTYGDIAPDPETHNLGEVWAATLWDMYWAFVDQYGWSENPYDEASGNYKAIRLVFDGLKNIPCSPGFVDGRNGILAADKSLYGGVDTCLIWKVFARRGIGYSADQGSTEDAGDQREAFDWPPVCRDTIVIEKTVTDFIQPGEDILVSIKVGNYKQVMATNVEVKDIIPNGTSYKINSSNLPVQQVGNQLSFQLGNLEFRDEVIITYSLESDPASWSQRKYIDEVSEQSNSTWTSYAMGTTASNDWTLSGEFTPHSGTYAWSSAEVDERSRQALELNPDVYTFHVSGTQPVMRFYHRYETQAGQNGGIVDIREVGAEKYTTVSNQILRNGYDGIIRYHTFIYPDIKAFMGNSGEDFEATYIDLSEWMGKDIQVRFRFGTYFNTHGGLGWLIDDIEFMDMLSYNSEVCVTTNQGEYACAIAPESGTIVDSRENSVSVIEQTESLPISIFPNPASDHISIAWSGTEPEDINVSLLSIDGKVLLTNSFNASRSRILNVYTRDMPAGMYLLKLSTEKQQSVAKVIIQ